MSRATTGPRDAYETIARFLVDGAEVPDPADLAKHGLEALAYVRVPQPHPLHERWRDAYLASVATHLATRSALGDLVRAWRDRGIEVLLFKGFYLAEFLYASPAERFYRDIDVLVPEASASLAVQVAVDQGWDVAARRLGGANRNRHSHMEAVLSRQAVKIDLHRFAIHCGSRDEGTARRFTAAAWAASRDVSWLGSTIRVLDPRDSALMGLVVGRAWSHDGWRLKVPDYRDIELLADRLGVTREALVTRAEELGCPRTLELVLERCDPWRRRFDLRPPTERMRRAWTRAVAHERGPRMGWVGRRLAGATPLGLAAALPRLWRARRLVHRHQDAADLLARLRTTQTRLAPLAPDAQARLYANVRVGAALVQPSGDRCLIRSLALFEALRERGEPVALYLGVDCRGVLHAWIRQTSDAAKVAGAWASCPVCEVVATSPAPPSHP